MLAAPLARSPFAGGALPIATASTATEPSVLIEIEFTAGTWTDVAAYLRSASTKRGKDRALDKVDPGTLVLTLSNATRRFDPEYASGPYFGNLLPGKGIRLRATWNGATYSIFTGFIDRIVQVYDREKPNDSVAVFEASDGLAKLAAASLGSPMQVTMASEAPSIWLRLGERYGPYAYDRSGNNRHAVIVGSPTLGQGSLLAHDNDAAVTFPANVQSWVSTPPVAGGSIYPHPWTVEFWFAGELDVAVLGDVTHLLMPADGTLTQQGSLRVYGQHGVLDIDGVTKLAQYLTVSQWGTAASASVQAPSGLFDGNPHHVVIVGDVGQPLALYVDDVAQAGSTGTSMPLRDVGFAIGNAYAGKGALTIDEFAAWNTARSSTERARVSLAATGWAGETGNARITRILDAVGWPTADRSITTAFDTTLAGTDLDTSALEHLRAIETTIEGRLYVSTTGVLTLLGRDAHLVAPYTTSQVTFGDGPGEVGYVQLGDYALDLDLLTNVVRRTNGDTVTEASNAASITSYGRRDSTEAAEVSSEYLSLAWEYQLAAFRLAHYAQPVAYVEGLTIMPRSDPANLWLKALTLGLADRATFKRRPQEVGSAISKDVIIEGVHHDIRPKVWTTEYRIDAIDAQNYFLFDSTLWDSSDWRFAA